MIVLQRAPAWANLRVWAADLRDLRPNLKEEASALCNLLDVYDDLRSHSALAGPLWESCERLARAFAQRACVAVPLCLEGV